MRYYSFYLSPLGEMTMASDGEALTGLWFNGQKYDRAGLFSDAEKCDGLPVFQETCRWLELYFSGREPGFTPPLRVDGSDFKKLVARILLSIPYGQLMTYGEIAAAAAKELGRPHMSAQAVGGAVGHNRISLIIPCHRVVGSNGSLTGYAGGLERKKSLLTLEGIELSGQGLFVPGGNAER